MLNVVVNYFFRKLLKYLIFDDFQNIYHKVGCSVVTKIDIIRILFDRSGSDFHRNGKIDVKRGLEKEAALYVALYKY